MSRFKGALKVHEPGSIIFAGHSFGSVTTVQFMKSVYYSNSIGLQTPIFPAKPPRALAEQITPATPSILLDLWGLPFDSPATSALRSQPLPCFLRIHITRRFSHPRSPQRSLLQVPVNLKQVKSVLLSAGRHTGRQAGPHLLPAQVGAPLAERLRRSLQDGNKVPRKGRRPRGAP
ncbi:hypothetical protein MRB53_037503 [Persea americana]|nr:hypothetical protein MRB53_037503 [Persea americana]